MILVPGAMEDVPAQWRGTPLWGFRSGPPSLRAACWFSVNATLDGGRDQWIDDGGGCDDHVYL